MPTVAVSSGAYQDLSRIRQRIDHQPADFYGDDPNAALRFDELLVELEEESRGIFETLWGDQTPLTETDRTDTFASVPDDAALALVYPITDVSEVEYKRTLASDFETLDTDWYTHSDHRLILSDRPNSNALRYRYAQGNPIADAAERTTWGDLAAELRVTYDRGFGQDPPQDIQSIQIALIENMLASRKLQQTHSAAAPDELASVIDAEDVVTESLRQRIDDVTKPGLATISV
jgi:hypothetical protein